jgi:hypothetical protein
MEMARITIDRRHLRSQMLLGAVMHVVDKYICDHGPRNFHRDCARELLDLFHDRGVQIITDADRAVAGLSPRNADGVTTEELVLLEQRMLDAMRAPMIAPDGFFKS